MAPRQRIVIRIVKTNDPLGSTAVIAREPIPINIGSDRAEAHPVVSEGVIGNIICIRVICMRGNRRLAATYVLTT